MFAEGVKRGTALLTEGTAEDNATALTGADPRLVEVSRNSRRTAVGAAGGAAAGERA